MLSNLFNKFVKTAAIALVGNIAAAFLAGLASHQPTGLDTFAGYVYPLAVAGLTGALASILRRLQWDPTKLR